MSLIQDFSRAGSADALGNVLVRCMDCGQTLPRPDR